MTADANALALLAPDAKAALLADALAGALIAGDTLQPVRAPASDKHAPSVYLASLAPGSRRTMRGAILKIAHLLTGGRCDPLTLPWGALRWPHVMAVRAAAAAMFAVNTARKIVCALRGVLKSAWRLGQMKTDHYQRAIDVPTIRGENLPRGRALSPGEIRALFAACAAVDDSPTSAVGGARDAALLALLYGSGLRREEAVSLELRDYNPETGELRVREGKGNKERLVYVSASAREPLDEWIAWRGRAAGSLFCPMTRGGRLLGRRLTSQAIQVILSKRMQQAGLAHFSPHDLRRTFISDLLDAGADIATVQKLAGHSAIQTTARYDRRGEATKKRASELLHIPFVRAEKRR